MCHRRHQLVLRAFSCLRRRLSIGVDKGAVERSMVYWPSLSKRGPWCDARLGPAASHLCTKSPDVTSSPWSLNRRRAI